jgi:hypothetical protein
MAIRAKAVARKSKITGLPMVFSQVSICADFFEHTDARSTAVWRVVVAEKG